MIVDDEPLAIDVLENYLHRLHANNIIRCENAVDAFTILKSQSVDLVFLDIEMPLLTGIELLKSIKDPPTVIITTAYRDYAVEGFEFEVVDYLIKPVPFSRFMKAIERVLKIKNNKGDIDEMRQPAENEFLFLKVEKKYIRLLLKDVLFIESLKDYIRVITKSGSYISYQSLTSITEKLPANKFVRIHRSFTIAIDKVNSIDGNCVEIEGKLIPISRDLKQDVIKKIHR